MFKKIIACSMLVFVVQASHADDAHQAAVANLANALHMTDNIEAMKLQAKASNEKQIGQVLAQIQQSYPTLSAEQLATLRTAAYKLINSVSESWSSDEAAKIYTTNLMQAMPTEQAQAASAFYASPEGQRTLTSVATAEQQMAAYITSSQEKAMAANYAIFMDEIKKALPPKTK